MKVVFVSTTFIDKNGISTFVLNNATYFSNKLNVKTYIVSPNIVDKYTRDLLTKNNVHLVEIPFRKRKPLKYLRILLNFLRTNNFDVIHVNGNSSTMGLELFVAKLAKIPLRISHCHNTKTGYPLLNKLLKPIFNFSVNCRMACSQEAGKWLYGKKKFFIIDNGIDLNEYFPSSTSREKIRERYNLTANDFVLINVGYFNYQKNQFFLIDVISSLPSNYKLILVGEGTNLLKIKKVVEQKNLKNRVIFVGAVNNVNEFLSAADVFLLPSRYEGFPFSLVEAQAAGLPCVVSNMVTKKVNLTGMVKFCSLKDTKNWNNEILKLKRIDFYNRLMKTKKIDSLIAEKGYSIGTNAVTLLNIMKNNLENESKHTITVQVEKYTKK